MSTLHQSLAKRREGEAATVSCVKSEESQPALLVSTWQGVNWVLPWAQFVSARLEGDRIELTFGNCVVVVSGENLPALLGDIAAYRIAALHEMPAEYRRKAIDGEPFISRIEVRLTADAPARDPPA